MSFNHQIVNGNIGKNYKDSEISTTLDDDIIIVVVNSTAKWSDNQKSNSLEKINLTMKSGRLLAVIGFCYWFWKGENTKY